MPRVIAIQQPMTYKDGKAKPAFLFDAARQYGTVEVLASNGRHILTPDVLRSTLEAALVNFNAEKDYIIPCGDYAVIFLVGLILGSRCKCIKILRWVGEAQTYQPLLLNIRS